MIKKPDLTDIHARAMKQFTATYDVNLDERQQCLEDRRFYSVPGAMWEGPFGEQFENKVKLEINKAHLSVMRIINEYRNNRITVDFQPKDGETDQELSDTCNGLFRSDETDSGAEEAYDNAFEEAASGGIGAWRLRTDYVDMDDDADTQQRIYFEPIYDADSSVWFDVNAKKQDKSDGKHAFVITGIDRDSYIEDYDDDPSSWPSEISQNTYDWVTPNFVYVAEYYVVETVKDEVITIRTVDGEEDRYRLSDIEDDEAFYEHHAATGSEIAGSKKIRRQVVHKYLMSGSKIIEDQGIIAGTEVPVIPVYGKRWFVDSVERYMGHIRLVKDVSRLKNMQMSQLAAISATGTVRKPIFTPEQVAGFESLWSEDNVKNNPYLLLNAIQNVDGAEMPMGPVGYAEGADVPLPMAALLQLVEQDMKDLLGNQEQGEEVTPNLSGVALEKIQNRLDMQSFIYMSNMAKAVKRSGEVWIAMARDVYREAGRKLRTVVGREETGSIELMKPVKNMDTGETVIENDMSKAKFRVVSDVGPTSTSRRASTLRSILAMMQITQDPETIGVLSAMAVMNMEGEGMQDARGYFRDKLIKLGVVKPTEQETVELQKDAEAQPPDQNEAFLAAAANEANAKADKMVNEAKLVDAKAEETRAKTIDILADMDRRDIEQVLALVDQLREPATLDSRAEQGASLNANG